MSELPAVIRAERVSDVEAIHEVLTSAFEGDDEAQLVDVLRGKGAVLVSMVAELAGVVVGHVAFTRACIEWGGVERPVAALGPMAVSSRHQRQGIG
ncbi:MAG: N-acetyltransferase, partial [Gemmatimonadales bacterium]